MSPTQRKAMEDARNAFRRAACAINCSDTLWLFEQVDDALRAALAEADEWDALRAAIDDAEHAEDCQCFIRAKWDGKYDAAWCDCWLAKIYAIDAARKEMP